MVLRSELNEWINGNKLHFDKNTLIQIADYWQDAYKHGILYADNNVIEDVTE
jgi:hypothetical protein